MKKSAFTLIELLVVISIIAVLAGLLLPTMSSATKKARQTQCASNLRQLYIATNLYAQENDGLIVQSQNSSGVTWPELLAPYLQSKVSNIGKRLSGVLSCPASVNLTAAGDYSDYGKNYYTNGRAIDDYGLPHHQSLKFIQATDAASVYLFADSTGRDLDPSSGSDTRNGFKAFNRVHFRHSDMANMLYLDGHAAAIKLADMPTKGDYYNKYPWNPTPQ